METKTEVWAIFVAEARKIQSSNETIEQAIDRVCQTRPDLVQRYEVAPHAQPQTTTQPDPWAGRRRSKAAYEAIERKAEELRQRDPGLTKAQAFDRVWSTDHELRSKYQTATEEDQDKPEDEPVEDSEKKKDADQSAVIDAVIQKTIAVSFEAFKALQAKPKPPAKSQSENESVLVEYGNGMRRLVSRSLARRLGHMGVTVLDDGSEAA